ncbi:MAG: succinylglutamate desuccinylase [Cyclobacteriaceae bacterium]|jgi:succinylglutamate desuccinylase
MGELLAMDAEGDIYSPNSGMIFLPLYQPEGEDGFFIVEEV